MDDIDNWLDELESQQTCYELDDRRWSVMHRRQRRLENNLKREEMIARYQAARSAPIGSQIQCPTCDREHQKTTYHKVFCSNSRSHGKHNCKDKYWNFSDMQRHMKALDIT